MVRIKAGVLERGTHLLLQTWWVVAVVRTDAPQHVWLWLCQLQGALNLHNQKICTCREQQIKFHRCCRDMVWSLPFLDILGQEASDGQTEEPTAAATAALCLVWLPRGSQHTAWMWSAAAAPIPIPAAPKGSSSSQAAALGPLCFFLLQLYTNFC